jgi:hydrogenase/urease accessory protein HupE
MNVQPNKLSERAILAVAIFALVSLSGCSGAAETPRPTDANVYVVGVGWHTQIYIQQTDASGDLRTLCTPGARYVGFGFAQRGFVVPKKNLPIKYIAGFFRRLVPVTKIAISKPNPTD